MARIEHVAIYAADSTALADFYVQTFGLKVVLVSNDTPPGYFVADDKGTAIEIIPRPAGESNVNQRWICHLGLVVDDVAATQAKLEAQRHRLRDRHRREYGCGQDVVLPRSGRKPLPDHLETTAAGCMKRGGLRESRVRSTSRLNHDHAAPDAAWSGISPRHWIL